MSADIRQVCDVCGVCAQFQVEKPKEPMKSHTVPELPWATISVDLFQLEGKNYIVMVDHYSEFIELDYLKNTTANVVIKAMKKNFARHGIPSECISDNGQQFVCYEYKSFAKEYGFISVTSSPYYSQGNGKAESAVKVAKNILKKSGQEDPYLALLAYRNTPQQGYTYSPAERLMSRKLKDIIPAIPTLLQPCPIDNSVVTEDIMKRRKQSKIQYDKKASQPIKNLEVEDRVWAKPREKNKPWIYGKVVGKSNERSYVMQTPLGFVRRNRKHIQKAKLESQVPQTNTDNDIEVISLLESANEDIIERENVEASGNENSGVMPEVEERRNDSTSLLRRSGRVRRKPDKCKDYILG